MLRRTSFVLGLVLYLILPGCSSNRSEPPTITESEQLIAWLAGNNRSIEVSADSSKIEPEFLQLKSGASAGADRSASDYARRIGESPFGGPVEKLVALLFGMPIAAIEGAISAEPEVVSRNPAKEVKSLKSLSATGNLNLSEAIRDQVVTIGPENHGHNFLRTLGNVVSGPTAIGKSGEASLAIRVTSIEWRTRIDDSNGSKMRLRVVARWSLSRNSDGISADQTYTYESERMALGEWVANASSTLKAESQKAVQSIASQIVASLEPPDETTN